MIVVKSSAELERMRCSGRMVAEVLESLREMIAPGVTTLELDRFAENQCKKWKAKPAFKGYGGFPYTICASPNDRVVHGFPNSEPLLDGDIISIDFGLIYDGFYGDSAVTIAVGEVDPKTRKLLDVTRKSLEDGIAAAQRSQRTAQEAEASDAEHGREAALRGTPAGRVRRHLRRALATNSTPPRRRQRPQHLDDPQRVGPAERTVDGEVLGELLEFVGGQVIGVGHTVDCDRGGVGRRVPGLGRVAARLLVQAQPSWVSECPSFQIFVMCRILSPSNSIA